MPDDQTIDSAKDEIENIEQAQETAAEKTEEQLIFERFISAVLSGSNNQVKDSFRERADKLVQESGLSDRYHIVAVLEPNNSIDGGDLDSIFSSLKKYNADKSRDVLLVLLSRGGSIEPAYQISKVCKQWSASKFVVVIPRSAKSAATLIALGADEIHIGPLGQLGPIDPQLGGLPALSIAQALQTIAGLCQKFPASSEMFAGYLKQVLTVEQIGYCDRIAQSASQYATRLLSAKPSLKSRAEQIALRLVQEYKDHSFVIDIDEARQMLGEEIVKSDTAELQFAENLYDLFEEFNYFLKDQNKRLLIAGNWADNCMILNIKRK